MIVRFGAPATEVEKAYRKRLLRRNAAVSHTGTVSRTGTVEKG
jgi:hypothetical protein